MLWWHILICIISIHKIVHPVQSQDNDDDNDADVGDEDQEESTTISRLTTIHNVTEQSVQQVSLPTQNLTFTNRVSNESEQNMNQIDLNISLKHRIIIALAVLCVALAVLLGLLISIVIYQWLQKKKKEKDDLMNGRSTARPDFVDSSYNYHDHTYQQAIKL
ncbi:unnamed protein product [Adineta steineri]|uniref:Uncharacterized protein n=1 Tax=Adineta steineri TaxID=433720 RepID=A0A819VV91_9BILA|nr:unnamed protein product [Adineta steineri]CAF1310626.1 unnamed protein product [Adineta steineri]CAF4114857.1 unnamed protein product [Adineta steineri]CAF4167640.1 unnamed protein product [Adineta steineri]